MTAFGYFQEMSNRELKRTRKSAWWGGRNRETWERSLSHCLKATGTSFTCCPSFHLYRVQRLQDSAARTQPAHTIACCGRNVLTTGSVTYWPPWDRRWVPYPGRSRSEPSQNSCWKQTSFRIISAWRHFWRNIRGKVVHIYIKPTSSTCILMLTQKDEILCRDRPLGLLHVDYWSTYRRHRLNKSSGLACGTIS